MAENKLGKLSQLDMGGVIKNVHDEQGGALFVNRVKSQVPGTYDRSIQTYTEGSLTNIKFFNDDRSEISEVSTLADSSGSLNNTYFVLRSALNATLYHVWFNVATAGTDPAPANSTAIEIPLNTNDPAYIVAKAIELFVGVGSDFRVNVSGDITSNIVLIETSANGDTTDTADFDTGFGFSVAQDGRSVLIANVSPTPVKELLYFWNEAEGIIQAKNLRPGSEFYLEVGKGNVPGHSLFNIQGSSLDLDISDGLAQIVNFAKFYTYKTSNATLSVVSLDAADTNIIVQITGVDEDFIEVVEVLSLNGTTPVSTVNNFIAVNRALIVSSGGVTGNQGDITFTHTSDIIAQINANLGSTEHGIFYVPVGKTLMINNVSTSLVKKAGSSSVKEMTIRLNVSGAGTNNSMGSSLPIGMRSDSGPFILNLETPQRIPEKSIVSFLATALVNNAAVNAIAIGILIDDDNF